MMDKAIKTMRRAGGMAIAMGCVAVTTGVAVGVGCIVMGAKLLSRSH